MQFARRRTAPPKTVANNALLQATPCTKFSKFLGRIQLPLECIWWRRRRISQCHRLAVAANPLVFDNSLAVLFKLPHRRNVFEEFSMQNIQHEPSSRPQQPGHRAQHRRVARVVEIAKALPHADHRIEDALQRMKLSHIAANESQSAARRALSK